MNKNLTALLIVGVVAVTAFIIVSKKNVTVTAKAPTTQNTCSVNGDCPLKNLLGDEGLVKIDDFIHAHGLAVDIASSSRLYIATHKGLDVLLDDTNLYQIGKNTDDQMGFVVHPKNSNVLFSSGHPETGGTIGFQKSEDGGTTWKKISDGINGPVDFHTMTISPINPDIIYGWHNDTLQRSNDGGQTWKLTMTKNLSQVISLTVDPQKTDRLYASTASGIMVSGDNGETWNVWSEKFRNDFAIVLAFNPKNTAEILTSTKQQGFLKTTNGGLTWKPIDPPDAKGRALFVAYDPQNSLIVYALLTDQSLYKSADGGDNWKKIR